MFETLPNDLNHLTFAGRVVRAPAYSDTLACVTVTLLNSRNDGDPRDPQPRESRVVLCIAADIANLVAARVRKGQHVTFEGHIETRQVRGTPKLLIVATDYAINNTRNTVRESGHGDGADEFEVQPRPIHERFARRSWDAEQPDPTFDIPF